jgi:hypothetical protein
MKYYLPIQNEHSLPCIVGQSEDELIVFIPIDELNPNYLEYVQWLFDGNTAEEWQPDTTTESVES